MGNARYYLPNVPIFHNAVNKYHAFLNENE
jgi:hypothetical protein